MKELKRGDLETLFIYLTVLVGETYGRAAQSGTNYRVCVNLSKSMVEFIDLFIHC